MKTWERALLWTVSLLLLSGLVAQHIWTDTRIRDLQTALLRQAENIEQMNANLRAVAVETEKQLKSQRDTSNHHSARIDNVVQRVGSTYVRVDSVGAAHLCVDNSPCEVN